MALILNRASMTTATTGTGTITLGSAVTGYQSYSAAGAVNGLTYQNLFIDGSAWEISHGVYTSSGTTMTRVLDASSTGSLLNLSGSATVTCVAATYNSYVPAVTVLQRTTSMNVNDSTDTDVSWDTSAVQDDIGAFSGGSPTIVTVPTGYTKVRVTVHTNWASSSSGWRLILFQKNGATLEVKAMQAVNESPDNFTSKWYTVAATDTLKIRVSQNSGGAKNFAASSGYGNPYVQFEWSN